MKIALYTICKNESKFVKRFMDSVREADGVFVTDTGSTDNTVELLKAEGAHVQQIKVIPWRFDVARNISMNFIPEDYDVCVCIDLDEVLTPGWRQEIEKAFEDSKIDRLRYQYVWSTLPDGRDGITFWYDKIHTRRGFRWVKPVHEVMEFDGGWPERQGFCNDFKLYHYPDPTKSRSSYLGLLELAVKEDPTDDRSSHYLGREYMYYNMNNEAIAELKRHLTLPSATWRAERAASMRFLGRCHERIGDWNEAESWFLRACAESPIDREPWYELGKHYYAKKDWAGCYGAMMRTLSIVEKPASYICEPDAWGEAPHDLASLSAYYQGFYQQAYDHAVKASELSPNDERLKKNVQFCWEKLQ